jgi:hypothetical protein
VYQHRSSSFVSVTADKATASTLVGRSPFHYEHVTTGSRGSVSSFLSNWPAGGIATKPQVIPSSPAAEGRDEASGDVQRRSFVLYVWPSPAFQHRRLIERSPLHGPWPKAPGKDSFAASTLRAVVPRDIMSDGLSDWETGTQHDPEAVLDRDRVLAFTSDKEQARFWVARRQRKQLAAESDDVMNGLSAFRKTTPAANGTSNGQEGVS